MNAMLANFINGNLSDAKRQAKKYAGRAIFNALVEYYGFSIERANKAAQYLKNPSQANWDRYCSAV